MSTKKNLFDDSDEDEFDPSKNAAATESNPSEATGQTAGQEPEMIMM